ncbi:MAG: DUF192 domain-containing protein [Candidatus Nealsonbacteria bacterium]
MLDILNKFINKKMVVIILFLVLIIFGLIIFMNANKDINEDNQKQAQVCFQNNCFKVELAQTAQDRKNGLMFREKMDLDKGMFFIFENSGNYSFWMKNVLISLDIIWIDENKEVVFIKENALPCKEETCLSINPNKQAKYVLEVNAEVVKQTGLKIGDKLDIKI